MSLAPEKASVLFERWARMDKEAVDFLKTMARAIRLADDIVDGDSQDAPADMARLLYECLIVLPANPFFARHHAKLAPVMTNVALLWDASEDWRKSDLEKTRQFAFVLRESTEQIVATVAEITGGFEHARSVIREVHQVCCAEDPETFEQWDQE